MWAAAGDAQTQDAQVAIILAVIGLLTAVLVAVIGGFFTMKTARASRTEPAPPTDLGPRLDTRAYERIAVTERRMDDNDDRDEIQDRRLDQIERALDLDNPDWRHR